MFKWANLYKMLLIAGMAISFLICDAQVVYAQDQSSLSSLGTDNLGEKVGRFKKRHRAAQCHRSQLEDFRTNRRNLLMWVTCSVDRDVTFAGYPLLSELTPEYPFGLTAMFRNRKLVQLNYVLALDSLETVLPTIINKCGIPLKMVTDSSGRLSSASWIFGTSVLFIEKTPINSEIYEGAFVRITKTTERFAVAAHIYLND